MTAGIELVEGLAANRGAEAARLVPLHATCATVDWPLSSDDAEETVRPDVVALLSQALAACGSVAFRHDHPSGDRGVHQSTRRRSLKDRLIDVAGFGSSSFGLLVATDPVIIANLFAYGGWSYASQLALVFDPDADPAPIMAALRESLDWRNRLLPAGVRLLFGPGHDGDFAVVAAADPSWLSRFKAELLYPAT